MFQIREQYCNLVPYKKGFLVINKTKGVKNLGDIIYNSEIDIIDLCTGNNELKSPLVYKVVAATKNLGIKVPHIISVPIVKSKVCYTEKEIIEAYNKAFNLGLNFGFVKNPGSNLTVKSQTAEEYIKSLPKLPIGVILETELFHETKEKFLEPKEKIKVTEGNVNVIRWDYGK
jgi:hypothetical protein